MVTQGDVVRYLMGRGLLRPRSIVDGDVIIRDASSRNCNFIVDCREGPCYLLKQGPDPETAAAVAHEAAVYEILSAEPGLRTYLPAFLDYDPGEQVLILDLVRDAVDLRTYQHGRRHSSVRVGAALGDALGRLHRLPEPQTGQGRSEGSIPRVLSIHRPDLGIFCDASSASLELIRLIQGVPGFGDHLDGLREAWRATALIHQDVKWANVLVAVAPPTAYHERRPA